MNYAMMHGSTNIKLLKFMELICIMVREYVFVRHGLKGKAHIRNKYLGLLREKHRKENISHFERLAGNTVYSRLQERYKEYRKKLQEIARNSDAREIFNP